MNNNPVTEPTDELTMQLPWRLTAKIACQAMIHSRSWNEQVRISLTDGLNRVDQEKREYRAMVQANKGTK